MPDRYEPSRSTPPAADRPDPPLAPLVAYWLGLSVLFGALITVILPSLVAERVDPGVKSSAVALIAAVEALVAIAVQPIAGAFSDHHRTRWGRRHPWIVVGVALQVVALLALIVVPGYWWLLVVMVCVELTSNSAQGPYQGLLPDLVPVGRRGRASGLMGAAQLGGQILGAAIAGLAAAAGAIPLAIVFAAASVALGAAATVLGVHEPDDAAEELSPPSRRERAPNPIVTWVATGRETLGGVWGRDLLDQGDFLWLLASRLAILMAAGTLQPFILYYLQDALGLGADAAPLVAPIAGTVAFAALFAAVPAGTLTARYGRVRVVGVSSLIGAVGAVAFSVAPGYLALFPVAIPFGIALGAFLSADWALMADIVPPREAGRYLGVSNTATAGAALLAVVIAGPVADLVNGVSFGLGYRAIFLLAAIEFVIGAWCIRHVPEPGPVADRPPLSS